MRALLLVAVLTFAAMAAAQQRTGESIEVSIVNVDVVVTDSQGKRVTGLTANDFEVREGGKPQPITHFAEYGGTAADADAATKAAAEESRPPRTVVVFIERMHLLDEQVEELYGAIRKLLRETITGPHDRAAVIGWTGAAAVRQPFTSDVAAVDAILQRMKGDHRMSPRDMEVESAVREQAASDAHAAMSKASIAMTAEEMSEFSDEELAAMGFEERPVAEAPSIHSLDLAMRQLARIRRKGVAIEALVNSMAAIEGRKIVVMAMHRFGAYAGVEGTESGTPPFELRRKLSNDKLHDSLIRAANANDIVLYPLYPAGPKWEGMDIQQREPDSDERRLVKSAKQNNVMLNEVIALEELAQETGGRMAWGTRNIAAMLPRVAEDVRSYYSLAYRAPRSGKDVSRSIEVRAKNSRYKVRSRRQFVEKSERTLMQEEVIANLYHGLGRSAFPVEVVLGEVKSTASIRTMALQVRVAAAALPQLPDIKQRTLAFHVVAGGSIGLASDVLYRTHAFPTGGEFYAADFTLQVDDYSDAVSVGVVDEATKEFGLTRVPLPQRK